MFTHIEFWSHSIHIILKTDQVILNLRSLFPHTFKATFYEIILHLFEHYGLMTIWYYYCSNGIFFLGLKQGFSTFITLASLVRFARKNAQNPLQTDSRPPGRMPLRNQRFLRFIYIIWWTIFVWKYFNQLK